MCTYNVRIDDALMKEVRFHFTGEEAIQNWLEQQVNVIVAEFARRNHPQQQLGSWSRGRLTWRQWPGTQELRLQSMKHRMQLVRTI